MSQLISGGGASFNCGQESWNRHNVRISTGRSLKKYPGPENTCLCPSDTSFLPNGESMGHKPHCGETRRPTGVGSTASKSSRIQTCRGQTSRAARIGAYRGKPNI